MSRPRNWRSRIATIEAAQRRIEAEPLYDAATDTRIPAEVRARIAAVKAGDVSVRPVTIPLRRGLPREVVAQIGAVMGADMDKVLG